MKRGMTIPVHRV